MPPPPAADRGPAQPTSRRAGRRVGVTALTLGLTLSPPAQAGLFQKEQGAWMTAELGVSGADLRFRPALAWGAGFGWLSGTSLGEGEAARLWGVGLRVRQDLQWAGGTSHVRTAPMLELRRSLDLFGLGVHAAVLGGPLFDSDVVHPTRLAGGTLRAAGGFRYPLVDRLGLLVRLEVGVDIQRPASPSLGLTVGLENLLGL